MAKDEKLNQEKVTIESGRIKSRVNYDITINYDGRDCIVAPRQVIDIPDFSKLKDFDPKEIVKLKA